MKILLLHLVKIWASKPVGKFENQISDRVDVSQSPVFWSVALFVMFTNEHFEKDDKAEEQEEN